MLTSVERGLPVLDVRTFAYLVAGHIVSLLDDINLVQEAGRKRQAHGVFRVHADHLRLLRF